MRLLNANTLKLETVTAGKEPPYAILSHRWTADEVLFSDIENGTEQTKGAYKKLLGCCKAAIDDGLTYVWIDTCCINQTSSVELSEAINSMFRWYRNAEFCYAHLHDATGLQDFDKSEWFDRGWTLQELIAPQEVYFYNKDWKSLGNRTKLSSALSRKTRIAEKYLQKEDLGSASIAERMSWAAQRKTTKPEDIAYCLLGIFDIHMSLIYGEGGEKAFMRLQRELIDNLASEDYSWLAWSSGPDIQAILPPDAQGAHPLSGMLARSPASFQSCRDVVVHQPDTTATIAPVNTTNVGINVRLPILQNGNQEVLLLGCHWRHDYWNMIAVPVAKHLGRYYRISTQTTICPEEQWSKLADRSEKLLAHEVYLRAENRLDCIFKPLPLRLRVIDVVPPDSWSEYHSWNEDLKCTRIQIGGEEFPTHRFQGLVRLRRDPNPDDGLDPNDYLIRLEIEGDTEGTSVSQLGLLPRDAPTPQVDDNTGFGKAVSVPGQPAALTAKIVKRSLYGKEAFVVDVFIDETRCRRAASRSRVLSSLPSQLEKARERKERMERKRKEKVARDRKAKDFAATFMFCVYAGIIGFFVCLGAIQESRMDVLLVTLVVLAMIGTLVWYFNRDTSGENQTGENQPSERRPSQDQYGTFH